MVIMEWKGKVLFNDTLNTFYFLLYGVGHMVKYHSDSERGNLIMRIIKQHLTDRIINTTAFVTTVV